MSVDTVSVVIRALSFVALFQAAGVYLFMLIQGQQQPESELSIRRLGRNSALIGILLVGAHQLLGAARMTGEVAGLSDLSMHMLALKNSAGATNILRLLALLLIATTILRHQPLAKAAGITAATLVVMSFILTGHTSSAPQRWILAPLLLLHLWVAAFWFGSLWPLYRVSTNETAQVAANLIAQFSRIASWLVPSIAIAGVMMALMLLPNMNTLLTPYGMLLVVKAITFAVLMGFAAVNKWRLGPAIATGDARAMKLFKTSLAFEYALICVALTATAVMTGLFSPESE
ncbi:MAG: copper resistance D family protein [Steroidobacteraceae bacterium]